MLNFILGRSGSGKSEKIRKLIKEKIRNSENEIILIVPEQSSFENERKMLKYLGNKDFNKIRVLSFQRLYDFVFQVLNIPVIKVPSDISQIVTMNALLENVGSKLKLYKKNSGDVDTAGLMLKTIKELKINNIDFATLDKIESLAGSDVLKQKISEIKLITQAYENAAKENFLGSFDTLEKLKSVIGVHNIFKKYDVFFDEFSYFTPQQLSILEIIFRQAKNVYMAFCCDENYQDLEQKNVFSCVLKTIIKIKKIAKICDVEVNEPIFCESDFSHKPSDLKMLEENIFRVKKIKSEQKPENIEIYSALNQGEECEHLAQIIQKLVIEKNYRYKDFVVLTRDISSYLSTVKSTFRKYNIPYFSNSTEKIFNKSIMNLIFSLLDLVNSNFSAGDMFRFLKSGLLDFSVEEISLLENYVLRWNIFGKAWFEDFTGHPEGLGKVFKQDDEEKLCELNTLRKKLMEPLFYFRKSVKKATGKEISLAIYELVNRINAQENLRSICKELSENGQYILAQQEAMAWDLAMEMLSEITNAFENIKISVVKYKDILFSIAANTDFSFVPQTIDNVLVGDADKVRIQSPKVVFIVGAVNGEFPKVPDKSVIFTDSELSEISSFGIEFGNSNEEFLMQERFLAYISLSKACEKLFVSWPSSNLAGKGQLPSEIIKEIKLIFPNIKIFNRHNIALEDTVWCKKTAFEVLNKNLNGNSSLVNVIKRYFSSDEKYEEKYKAVEKLITKNKLEFENSSNAKLAFSKDLKFSASQIEKYYTCRFGYFCEYILKARSIKQAKFGALEYGNIVHFLFEKLFRKYPNREILNVPLDNLKNEINEIIEIYVTEKLGGYKDKNERFKYTVKRLKLSLVFLVSHFVEEFKQSLFDICDVELEISSKGDINPLVIELSNDEKVIIEGKIDRVDIMRGEDCNYLRIIDYKTGAKEFKLSDVFYGLNMQMLIYLIALEKNTSKKYGKILPAGMLYFTALKPIVDTLNKNSLSYDLPKQVFKKLRMNGLVLENLDVISGMEQEGKGIFIPAEIKNGEIKKSQSVTSLQEFKIIENHVEFLIKKMALCLKSGKISAAPICKTYTACQRCDYFPICCYEDENFIDIPNSVANKKIIEEMARGLERNNE